MAISRNLTLGTMGIGRAANGGNEGGTKAPVGGMLGALGLGSLASGFGAAPIMTAPPAFVPAPPPGVAQPAPAIPHAASPVPGMLGPISVMPGIGIRDFGDIRPPILPPIPPRGIPFHPQVEKTTTQIAQGALNQLRVADPVVVREALSNVKNKNIAADDLMNYLERRTRVGEVLNELANDWSAQTKQDFAEAFQMPNTAEKLPVMDSMVSVAILNDPDLKNELQAENTTEVSQGDLLENRRIVWQWPQPGTAFTPPYLIVVAVEQLDLTQAKNIIQSILGDLVDFQGYKIPSAAAQKLR